jgi:hypothetical protein
MFGASRVFSTMRTKPQCLQAERVALVPLNVVIRVTRHL